MNFNDNEEELEFLNRLLDRLRQAGLNANGSHLQLVYVAPGAQHINTQYVEAYPQPLKPHPLPPCPKGKGEDKELLPEALRTPETMMLWQKAQRAGYVDEHYQPLLSRTQAALLADAMAERLGIKEKWKVFEGLWNRKYMRNDYNLALTRKRSLDFQDKLKRLFG